MLQATHKAQKIVFRRSYTRPIHSDFKKTRVAQKIANAIWRVI